MSSFPWTRITLLIFTFLASAKLQAASGTLFCYSQPGQYAYCRVPGEIESASLYQQFSQAPCVQGYTWNYDAKSLWVYNGCQANFLVNYNPNPDPVDPVPGNPSPGTEYVYRECISTGWETVECPVVDEEGHSLKILNARVHRQLGEWECNVGSNWHVDHDNNSIVVERGCGAEFKIKVRK